MKQLLDRLHGLGSRLAADPGRLLNAVVAAGGTCVLLAIIAFWLLDLARREPSPGQAAVWGLLGGLAGLLAGAAFAAALWGLREASGSHEQARRARNVGAVMAASVGIGVLTGLGAIAFYWLLELVQHLCLASLAGFSPQRPKGEAALFEASSTLLRPWVLLFLPAAGGLVSGLLVYRFAPEAEGHGTDAAIDAYHHLQGRIRGRVPLVKALSSAITIGTGGSAGREGPIAQIGAGLASALAERLNLARRDRATLMAAGLAGGIGAIFHAPLAGAIFAAEVMYRELDLEHEVIVPSFIASIVAYSVFSLAFGWSPLFETPSFNFEQPLQLIPYLLLALVVALGARLFVRLFYGTKALFRRLPLHRALRPALGGLLVGFIGLGVGWTGLVPAGYGVLASGYGALQEAFESPARIGMGALLLVAAGKMATTSFSVGSGGSGGVFGPATVIGGSLGGAVGLLAAEMFPTAGIHPGAFVMVGMAGFFAAAGHTPLSTIIIVGEMTGNYELLVPSMLVCVVAFLLAGRHTIFENQLPTRLDAPGKTSNMMSAMLRRLRVSRAIEQHATGLVTVPSTLPVSRLLELLAESGQECFPLVDEKGRLAGIVEGRTLRHVAVQHDLGELLLAVDIASEPLKVTPEDDLLTALHRLASAGRDELVVVTADDPDRPVATLSHRDIVLAYNRALQ